VDLQKILETLITKFPSGKKMSPYMTLNLYLALLVVIFAATVVAFARLYKLTWLLLGGLLIAMIICLIFTKPSKERG